MLLGKDRNLYKKLKRYSIFQNSLSKMLMGHITRNTPNILTNYASFFPHSELGRYEVCYLQLFMSGLDWYWLEFVLIPD